MGSPAPLRDRPTSASACNLPSTTAAPCVWPAEPGTRFTYTDHGFATLGQVVEDVSGKPIDRYLYEHGFEPLGMAGTDLLRSALVESHLATGYELGSAGAKTVTDSEVTTAGGGGIYSTPRDMARYLAALLAGGAKRAWFSAQARDPGHDVGTPVPAGSPRAGYRTQAEVSENVSHVRPGP